MKYKTRYYTYQRLVQIVRIYKKDTRLFFRRLYRLLRQKDMLPLHYAVVPEKRIAYLVNPKCACSSIKEALYLDTKRDDYSVNIHRMAEVVRNKRFNLNEKEEYFKFTFVRNPFKRIVSFYVDKFYRAVQVDGNPFPLAEYLGGVLSEKMTFAEMIKVIHDIPPYLANIHFKPQSYIIDKREVDFIGKLENINVEWEILAKRFNLPPLKQSNKNTPYNYMDYYDLETLELVNEYYKEDIVRFGYTDIYDEIKEYLATKNKK